MEENKELRAALDAVDVARSALMAAEAMVRKECMKHAREAMGAPADGDFIITGKDGGRFKVEAAHHWCFGDIKLVCRPFKKDGDLANAHRMLYLSEVLEEAGHDHN